MEQTIQNKMIQWILQPLASFMNRFSAKVRERIFVCAGLMIFLAFFLLNAGKLPVRYLILYTYGCLMMGLMILSILPEKVTPIRFDRLLLVPWAIVTLFMLISGITKSEDYLLETMMFLVAYPVFYIVGNNYSFQNLVPLLLRIVRISFYMFLLIVFLFFPILGQQYTGFFRNPNDAAIYLALVFSCCLVELLSCKTLSPFFFSNLISLGICTALIYYSNSRTGMLAILLPFILSALLLLICNYHYFLKTVIRCFLPVMLSAAIFIPSTVYIFQIPQIVFYEISVLIEQFEQTELPSVFPFEQTKPPSVSPPASGVLEKIWDKTALKVEGEGRTLDRYSSGRLSIWKGYLKNLSFWGHSNKEKFFFSVEGIEVYVSSSHMVILEFAYQYGILAGLFFLIFNLNAGIKSISYAVRRPQDYFAIFPFMVSITFGVISLFSTVDSSFSYMIVFYYYLVQCPLMQKEATFCES